MIYHDIMLFKPFLKITLAVGQQLLFVKNSKSYAKKDVQSHCHEKSHDIKV